MKLFLISMLITTMYANDVKLASSIFNTIVSSITHKKNATVYLYSDIESVSKYPDKLKVVKDCSSADVVLLSSIKNIPKDCTFKILFGTKYSHLNNKNVIGAFFWQKGRPNILFYKKRLEKYHIKLDKSFDKYIENQ
ncbi:MAG: hypothetical protein QM497_00560 [Sulfurimonas sp.]